MSAALQIDHLSKSYRTTRAVDGLDLRVEEGEIVGLLGPNGSGKTTTMECAYGLRKADSGTIRVFGVDSRAEPDRVARLVGTQLQDSALPDRIKVWEALHLFAALAGGDTVVRFPISAVRTVARLDGRIEVRGRGAFLVALGHALTLAGLSTVSLDVTSPSLEDAYVRLLEEAEP